MKLLRDILYKAGIVDVAGATAIPVKDIVFDSRKVTVGSLFVAVKGVQTDGHKYITDALDAGAVAVVCEEFPAKGVSEDITYVKVKESALALGNLAANYYDNPSEKLKLIGITGTNGKTTSTTLLFNLFRDIGYSAGMLSTIRNKINDQVIPSTHTTPDPIQLNAFLRAMVDEGCQYCFMEVSSHAVVQKRIAGLKYAGGVFTNITHDHLDYHQNFDEYIKAKKQFFDSLTDDAFALSNIDDKNGAVMLQNTKARKLTYSLRSASDFKAKVIENGFSGLLLNIDGTEVLCKLIGHFNAYNILSAYATAILLGGDKLNVLTSLSKLDPVEGRFEYITSTNQVTGIIDYAHSPDALENVLSTIDDIRSGDERIIAIIGCGGERDPLKRPLMAEIACKHSDHVILTSDNPRSEDPEKIIADMQQGVPSQDVKVLSITDRREAIKTACTLSKPGDIILLAGKGHEKYQEIKGVKHPFDDKQILGEMIRTMC